MEHELLEASIGVRTAQGLLEHYKRQISPKVESMAAGGTTPFTISTPELEEYKKAREEAEENNHRNVFIPPPDLSGVVRVGVD